MILKKISCKRLSEEKNSLQQKCNRNLIGKKREKNILPTGLLEKKKTLDDQKSTTTPPSQELNGSPLTEERKIAHNVKFARIAYD